MRKCISLMILISSVAGLETAHGDVENHASHYRSNLTFTHANPLLSTKARQEKEANERLQGKRIDKRHISANKFDADGNKIDDSDPLHYRSLSNKGLLLDQSVSRRGFEADAHRRELIRREDCPLILFFSTDFGGEAADGQMQDVPAKCRGNWSNWVDAATDQDESRLIASEDKKVIEREEAFDDTNMGKVKIDADGLAWLIEYVPPEEIDEPETYVILKPNGMRYTITDDDSRRKTTITKPRFKRTLLPQYSRPEALAKWHKRVGRGIASDTPEYEEAHW